MRDLIHVALSDDVLTEAEMGDLDAVRKLLDISCASYVALFDEVDKERADGTRSAPCTVLGPGDIVGKTICFTGQLTCLVNGKPATRMLAERAAADNGMIPKSNVTKGTYRRTVL